MDPVQEAPQGPVGSMAGTDRPEKKIAVGMILREAWRAYTQGFWSIAVIVAVIWAPLELLSSYMDYFVFGPEELGKSFRFARLLDTFGGIIATAGVLFFGQAWLSGERTTVGASLSQGLSAWGRMWLTRFFYGLYLLGGLLLFVLPAIYLLARLCLAEAVTVCEKRSGRDALNRSFELTRGRFWEIFRLGLSLIGLVIVVAVVVVLPTVLVPALDHWLMDAATNLIFDIAAAFGTLCFLCVYRELTAEERERIELPQVFQ